MPKPFPLIRAEWRSLLFLNYQVDAPLLAPYLPPGTELDLWEGRPLVSVVGLTFRGARALGIPIPFHQHFAQINLRFYVRTSGEQPARRGVVFIKEMVPSLWIMRAARLLGENYQAVRTGYCLECEGAPGGLVEYTWRLGHTRRGGRFLRGALGRSGLSSQASLIGRSGIPGLLGLLGRRLNRLGAVAGGPAALPAAGSLEEFVSARYWSFTRRGSRSTLVMRSEHPQWRVSPVEQPYLLCDVRAAYGDGFVPYLHRPPHSALLVEGSPVRLLLGYPNLGR